MSQIASYLSPLTNLLGKQKFYWNEQCTQAFNKTKEIADSIDVLISLKYDSNADFIFIFTNASIVSVGG